MILGYFIFRNNGEIINELSDNKRNYQNCRVSICFEPILLPINEFDQNPGRYVKPFQYRHKTPLPG